MSISAVSGANAYAHAHAATAGAAQAGDGARIALDNVVSLVDSLPPDAIRHVSDMPPDMQVRIALNSASFAALRGDNGDSAALHEDVRRSVEQVTARARAAGVDVQYAFLSRENDDAPFRFVGRDGEGNLVNLDRFARDETASGPVRRLEQAQRDQARFQAAVETALTDPDVEVGDDIRAFLDTLGLRPMADRSLAEQRAPDAA